MKRPVVLIIMDGYGLSDSKEANAVYTASTPNLDALMQKWPHTVLSASGEDVGLPAGQIGNSEVGHTNIGAGRVVYQDLSLITRDVASGGFFENEAYNGAVDSALKSGRDLHVMGLVSDGGVHSHIEHFYAMLKLCADRGLDRVWLHCFTDGRDVPPTSGAGYIAALRDKCAEFGVGRIADVCGRFYAMDRDKRWERLKRAYDMLTIGEGEKCADPVKAVEDSYARGVTDEFIEPVVCDENGTVKPGDSVVFMNFRPDRARELTRCFVDPAFDAVPRPGGCFNVHFVCTTQYDETMPNVTLAYPPEVPENTLGQAVSEAGLRQLRIAETEKYAHVTFFLNGGVEETFEGEDRILVDSPRQFATYDLIPEMSAYPLTRKTVAAVNSGKYDLIVLNFANCDMVGHTGVFEAAVKAVEAVDICVGEVVRTVSERGGVSLITADHGNAEQMLEEDGVTPHTAHTTNLVPFITVGCTKTLHQGRLCDIAPTILELLELQKPAEMTGESLFDR